MPGRDDLPPRCWEILHAVIHEHVRDGQPVGSGTVARRSREGLSPASVRNVMADLEQRGLLSQPHASAGRVPTDQAYRLYVDLVLESRRRSPAGPPPGETGRITRALAGTHGDFPVLLEEASRLLSRFSRNVGLVLAPGIARVVLERIDFIRLEGRRVLAVIVDPAGVVTHRLIEVEEEQPQDRLDRMARRLEEEFAGLTLDEARQKLFDLMALDRERCDALMRSALDLARLWLAVMDEAGTGDVFVGGASNIVARSEFSASGELQGLLMALEEKERLADLLGRCLGESGISVTIGSENEDPRLKHCSVLATSYGLPGRVLGTVGIIGPTRMEYTRTIGLLEAFARAMSLVLNAEGEAR